MLHVRWRCVYVMLCSACYGFRESGKSCRRILVHRKTKKSFYQFTQIYGTEAAVALKGKNTSRFIISLTYRDRDRQCATVYCVLRTHNRQTQNDSLLTTTYLLPFFSHLLLRLLLLLLLPESPLLSFFFSSQDAWQINRRKKEEERRRGRREGEGKRMLRLHHMQLVLLDPCV